MNYEEFAKKFIEVSVEAVPNSDLKGFSTKEAIEVSWMAFSRILRENNLAVLPDDPIRQLLGK